MHPMNPHHVFTEEQAQARDDLSACIRSQDGIPHRFSFTNNEPPNFEFCVLGCVHEQIRLAQPDFWKWEKNNDEGHYFLLPNQPDRFTSNYYLRGKAMEDMYGMTIEEEQSLSHANDNFRWSWERLAKMIDKRTEAIRRQIGLGEIERYWDTFGVMKNTKQVKWFVTDFRNGFVSDPIEKFGTHMEAVTYVMMNVPVEEGM